MRLACLALTCAALAVAAPSHAQSGEYRFTPKTNRPLTVYFHAPKRLAADTRVVFALHGLSRQGAATRDAWAAQADRFGFLVVTPHFDNVAYKGSANYSVGRVITRGERNDPSTWTFAVIDELFDDIKARHGLRAVSYTLFGHSAGAQFAHRLAQLVPAARVERVIAANAGWYTMMDGSQPYPWGLGGTGMQPADECRAFARPMTILLGDLDTDPNHDQLNRDPGAMKQGLHRLARGQNFFAASRARAQALGCRFAWTLNTAPGIGHEFDKMAVAAAALLHDKEQQ